MQHLGYGIPKSLNRLRACPIAVAESIKGDEKAQESPSHLVSVIFMCNLRQETKTPENEKDSVLLTF